MIGHTWIVLRKEVMDNFRDRRTLMSALFFGPLFGPLFFAFMISIMLSRTVAEVDKPLELPVVGAELAPNLIAFLEQNNVQIQEPPEDPHAAIAAGDNDVVLIIPEEYPERFIAGRPAILHLLSDSANSSTARNVHRARGLLSAYGQKTALLRLQARGINPQIMRAVGIEEIDVSTPTGRSVLVLGMMTYFILFAVLMGGLYLATDTTAGERERGSLEPLLTLPVTRRALIFGKIGATCAYMIMSLALTLAAFTVAIGYVPLEQLGMSANFGPLVALQVFLITLPFVLFGAGLLTVVASFTRSYKEAQTYLSVVLIIPTLPIVFAALYAVHPQLWMMTVPSLGQHLLITELMKGSPVDPLYVIASVLSTLTLGALLAWLAAHLYDREKILG